MAISKLTGKSLDLGTDAVEDFTSIGIDDNATSTILTINSSGNVGIGSSSNHAGARVAINDTPPTAFGSPMLQVGQETFTASGYYSIGLGYTAASYTEPPAEIAAVATSSSGGTTADIIFGTRSVTTNTAVTERMRISAGGNVGIGTDASISQRLHVLDTDVTPLLLQRDGATNDAFGSGLLFGNDFSNNGVFIFGAPSSGIRFGYTTDITSTNPVTTGTEVMRIDASGNVGIGTTPSAWYSSLQVTQNAVQALWSNSTGQNSSIGSNLYYDTNLQGRYITNGEAAQYQQYQGSHRWYNAPSGTAGALINGTGNLTERMRIDANGTLEPMVAQGTAHISNATGIATIANNGTVDFGLFSGMIIGNNHNTGDVSIWICGGGGVQRVSSTGSGYGSFSYVVAIGGYRWTNNTGSSRVMSFMTFKTRNYA